MDDRAQHSRSGGGESGNGDRRPIAVASGLEVRPRGYGVSTSTGEAHLVESSIGGGRGQTATSALVTVVLPVYNESGLIRSTFAAVDAFARAHRDYRFVFVDDGSSDGTPTVLRSLIDEARRGANGGVIDLIAYTSNAGKGHAVKVGIEAAQSAFVLFTDGDLAYALDHLPRLVKALEAADVVIGSRALVERSERNTTPTRKVMGWTFNKCARAILGLKFKDTQAGLKGFRTVAAKEIFARQRLGGFAFDVELVYLARKLGYRIAEIPAYVSEEHSYKRSKVNLVRDPLRMFGALVDVRVNALAGRYADKR